MSIAVGSVAPTVMRAPRTEFFLTGATVTSAMVEKARQMIAAEVQPISDLRSTETYRRTVTGNLLAAFLNQLT
jgi:xanthine dehydrogenase iron-sulfur cluster and FAD-binding subunit A